MMRQANEIILVRFAAICADGGTYNAQAERMATELEKWALAIVPKFPAPETEQNEDA